MPGSFVLRSADRGYSRLPSTGRFAEYVAGHPDGWITRASSFNFREYQSGRAGFGKIRVFGDEVFSGNGPGYNMHPHHNFIIMAFVQRGALTHINTIGKVDTLERDNFYIFSAGSGGKHAELNIEREEMGAIYVWVLPGTLYAPPSYLRSRFDRATQADRIVPLIARTGAALPIDQDLKVSRVLSGGSKRYVYVPDSASHGTYAFVLEGVAQFAGTTLERRDSIGQWGLAQIAFEAQTDNTDVLIIETAM